MDIHTQPLKYLYSLLKLLGMIICQNIINLPRYIPFLLRQSPIFAGDIAAGKSWLWFFLIITSANPIRTWFSLLRTHWKAHSSILKVHCCKQWYVQNYVNSMKFPKPCFSFISLIMFPTQMAILRRTDFWRDPHHIIKWLLYIPLSPHYIHHVP